MTDFPDVTGVALEDRAASLLGQFMEGTPRQKDAAARILLFAAERIAERCEVAGDFLGPFDINATATIKEMACLAEDISDECAKVAGETGFVGAIAYAAVAMICYRRCGLYKADEAKNSVAEMCTQFYGAARAARDR